MALNSYSNGKGYSQEMAKIRVYGGKRSLSYRRRYTTRGYYLTRTCKYDARWTRKEIKGTLSKNNGKRDSSKSQLCEIRRRFHRDSSIKRAARTRNQALDRSLHEGTRVRTLIRKNLRYTYCGRLRFPGSKCTQVQNRKAVQTADQTSAKECACPPGKDPRHHQEEPNALCWEANFDAQSDYSRMGTLSSAHSQRRCVQFCRRRDLSKTEAVDE